MTRTLLVGFITLGIASGAIAQAREAARIEVRGRQATHVYQVANSRIARHVADPMINQAGWACRAMYRGYVAIVTCTNADREITNVNVCSRHRTQHFSIPDAGIQVSTRCGDTYLANDVTWDR